MAKKVIISVTNDLVTDQRVAKVSQTLINMGFDVVLVGRLLKNSSAINRPYKTKRFKLLFTKSAFFYAEYNLRLFFYLLFSKHNILLSNDLDTLPANYLVSLIRRKKLVFDSHELFTEVPELVNRRFVRNFWLRIEKLVLPRIKYSYTVSPSIANDYKNAYGIETKVVRNFPYYTYNQNIINKNNGNKIIIYQGALNVGRGIEKVIEAMQYINGAVFWIIGTGNIENELKYQVQALNLSNKVIFIGRVNFENLKQYTLQAHLGVSLEDNLGLNYYYSLPNKVFDYIQAGVPVLTSNFSDISKIVLHYKVGQTIDEKSIANIANVITDMLYNDEKRTFWNENLKIAAKELNWENEEKVLVNIFKDL